MGARASSPAMVAGEDARAPRVVKVFVYVCNADFPMESAFFEHFLHFSLHTVYNLLCFLH